MQPLFPPPSRPFLPIPELIIRTARTHPDREIVLNVQDLAPPESSAAVTLVTWRQLLADVKLRMTSLVHSTGQGPRRRGESDVTVGLLSHSGYDYFVTWTAITMLRWTVLLISIRNTPPAIQHLMSHVNARFLLVGNDLLPQVQELVNEPFSIVPLDVIVSSSETRKVEDGLLGWDDVIPMNHDKSKNGYAEEIGRHFTYLHTSGSTGHPKPIGWTHENMYTACVSVGKDRKSRTGRVFYTPMPLFHGAGFIVSFPTILGVGGIFTFVESRQAISSSSCLRHMRILAEHKPDALLPPSILEDMIIENNNDQNLRTLLDMNSILFAGAPLRTDIGDEITRKGVRLVNCFGMTETGPLSSFCYQDSCDPADWSYIEINEEAFNFVFTPMKSDGAFHSLIITPGYMTPMVLDSQNPVGIRSSDRWVQHPDPGKARLWKASGRNDDVVVLSSGEKTDSVQLTSLLCASSLVSRALIFGTGRLMNGALVDPAPEAYLAHGPSTYLDLLWHYVVQNVNRVVPHHSRLIRSLVLVVNEEKPLLSTDKGTVKRKASLELYAAEIDAAYRDLEDGESGDSIGLSPVQGYEAGNVKSLQSRLSTLLNDVLGAQLGMGDDFFAAGMDSLLAIQYRSAVSSGIKSSGYNGTLPRNIIYMHPTISALSECIISILANSPALSSPPERTNAVRSMLEDAINAYKSNFNQHLPDHSPAMSSDDEVYAVTGTTGSLGSFFVSLLLDLSTVRKVYLLNRRSRSTSFARRHEISFEEKGLDFGVLQKALDTGRAVFVAIDLLQADLGISESIRHEMLSEVTHIVHIAWLLNFKLILPSFKPHLSGVRHLLHLTLSSKRMTPPHFTFISSVAAVGQCASSDPVPEASISSPEVCLDQGYAMSKYCGEKIIELAAKERPELRASIVRTGQISGAEGNGAWARSEYMPTLMKTSVQIGLVPDQLPDVRWLPVNVAAKALYAQIQHSCSQTTRTDAHLTFYNLENGSKTPWRDVTNAIIEFGASVSLEVKPKLVPMKEWVEAVSRAPYTSAFQLLDFFETYAQGRFMPTLDLKYSRQAAGSLVDRDIGEEVIRSYVAFACADINKN